MSILEYHVFTSFQTVVQKILFTLSPIFFRSSLIYSRNACINLMLADDETPFLKGHIYHWIVNLMGVYETSRLFPFEVAVVFDFFMGG